MNNTDNARINMVIYIISLIAGTVIYWLILSSYITSAFSFALSAAGYAISILFLLTRYNEYIINKDYRVMNKYCDDVMSVCPKCGHMHITSYSRAFNSRIFMNIRKYLLFQKNVRSVHVIRIAKCNQCGHIWYGGYTSIDKINSSFDENCVQNNVS